MASKNQEKGIIKLAIEYYVDGASLATAMSKAEKKYAESHKRTARLNLKEQEKLYKELEAKAKTTNVKIRRADVDEHLKGIKQKRRNEDKARKQRISAEKAADKAIADKRKNSFAGGFDNFGKKIGTISSYGAAIAIINGIRQAFVYAIGKAIEFETAFADLAVKTGYTTKEMANVSKTIVEVAQSTNFSTLEIIGAATALGKLGFEAQETADILPNLANVAAATGESLQATAEILGKVINAYEYTADQSGIISDRMVDIFNNSALNLEKFNTAFSYVGSAAASTGTSFNELTAAMAILSDRGITASKIGTGLRNVFTKLGNEGDSLRDILQRVSDAHLSFYEVAELVGRRAANQLFIMADSLDEFDANVARSSDDYGQALIAAGKQMDTFEAKWKIFINTMTNAIALPEFDADSTWKDSVAKSIGWLDILNASLNKINEKSSIKNFFGMYPKMREEFEKTKASMEWGASDESILDKMIEQSAALEKTWKFGSKEFMRQANYTKAIRRLNMVLTDDEDNISEALDNFDIDQNQNIVQKKLIDWQNAVENTAKKVRSKLGSEEKNAYLQELIIGDKESIEKALLDLRSKNNEIISEEDIKLIVDNLRNRSEKYFEDTFRTADLTSLPKILKAQYKKATQALKDVNNNMLDWQKGTIAEDEGIIRTAMDERKKIQKKICDMYPDLAAKLNIICETDKVRSKRDKGDVGDIDRFTQLREQYKTDKNLLGKQYANEDNPIEKMKINQKLIELEKTFRSQMNYIYNDYLSEQGAMRDEFCAKYPDQCAQFDANVVRTEESQIKDSFEGTRNLQTYSNRDNEAKAKQFEVEYNLTQAHKRKLAELNLIYRSEETDTAKKKLKVIEDYNKEVDRYYDEALASADYFYTDMVNLYNSIVEENVEAVETGGSATDVTKLLELIEQYKGRIDELEKQRAGAKKKPKETDNEDFDYFAAAMQTSEDLYNVYKEIGDRKLELLKEQTERELEVIKDRFDREAEIRNSALSSGIISQEQAREAEIRAEKKKIDDENKINKKLFEAQKKRDKEDAIFTGATSTAQAIANAFATSLPPVAVVLAAVSAAAIATSTAMNIKAISKRKFVPQRYEDGGLIEGKSHAQGGVPFTVNGQSGFEAEGGEFIVNKEATSKHLEELKRINSKTQKSQRKFADGGLITSSGSNEVNQAILDALNQPVKAYITTQDLRKSQSEREALTKKTNY